MAITIVVTTAGRAALVNAANTGTNAVTVTQLGVTETAFVPVPGLVALPGEIKRIASVAGVVVADDAIHVTASDVTPAAYTMRGFGLYLNDGTLFATYGQAGPILNKTSESMMLLALDIGFADIDAEMIEFGDTNFILPLATTEIAGLVELATTAEGQAGTDAQRALTPLVGKQSILGWLLSQDGAGSGLDADMLDGLHASAFAAAGHVHGTMANQNADNVNIIGGVINGTAIGTVAAAPASFTTLSTAGDARFGFAGGPLIYNVGFYGRSPEAGTIDWDIRTNDASYGARTAMTIKANANIGIGTVSPSAKLHVAGDVKFGNSGQPDLYNIGFFGRAPVGGTIDWDIRTNDATYGARTAMTISAAASIGIGTNAPTSKFHVVGDGSATSLATFDVSYGAPGSSSTALRLNLNGAAGGGFLSGYAAELNVGHNCDFVAGTGWIARSPATSRFQQSGGDHMWFSDTGKAVGASFVPTERMRLTASGRLGIGSAAPRALLDLGNAVGDKFALHNAAYIGLGVDMGGINGLSSYSNVAFNWGTYNGAAFTEHMRLSGGNLGVGITNPLDKLHLPFTGAILLGGNGASAQCRMPWYFDGGSNVFLIDTGHVAAGETKFIVSTLAPGGAKHSFGVTNTGPGFVPAFHPLQANANALGTATNPWSVGYFGGSVQVAGNAAWHAGNDGAGSGLDADLLDGLNSSAFLQLASFIGSEILSRLVTVDGSGSGLDADLLDGYHASSFDRIVEQNLTAEGGYIVYASGRKECWGSVVIGQDSYATWNLPVAHTSWCHPSFTYTGKAGVNNTADNTMFVGFLGAPPYATRWYNAEDAMLTIYVRTIGV